MAFFRQLKVLCWKNYTLRKRQRYRFCVELLVPAALFIFLALVRLRESQHRIHECHFDEKPMPSAGMVPFLQVRIEK